jgi:hypothetical protein
VFGAGILLHDAGITISAFPGGLAELKDTPEWGDAVAVAVDKMGTYWQGDPEAIELPPALLQQIVFSVLRSIHGRVAETLCGLELQNPNTGARMRLLEDDQLRLNYGSLIGQIASSHNWPIEDVPSKLQKRVGAIGGLPADWSIDPVKVAGLLRCADAAQIDQRRAPDFLYALLNLSGLSDIHWRAQNKLAQPVRDPDDQRALLFSSTGPYSEADADAWWVAWDLITVANNELQATASLMRDTNRPLFQINRVRDADSPSRLANHVTTFGWMPVRADLKVSDPEHVAKILGGRELLEMHRWCRCANFYRTRLMRSEPDGTSIPITGNTRVL